MRSSLSLSSTCTAGYSTSLHNGMPTPEPTFRRNGKLQACEPCRIRKIRCDHVLPTCGRCIRMNRAAQCHYHSAPLTRANGGRAPTAPPAVSVTTHGRNTSTSIPSPSTAAPWPASTIDEVEEVGASSSEVGYLGPTSFSEVFKASKHTSDDVWLGSLAQVKRSLRTPAKYRLSSDRLTSGSHLLSLLSDHVMVKKTLKMYYAISQVVVVPWITLDKATDAITASLKTDFSTNAQRLKLVEKIFANTGEPLELDEKITAETLHESFTGDNLR